MKSLDVLSFGVASHRQLLAAGHTKHEVERHLRHGSITRLRRGWFAQPGANPLVATAVRAGGVLTGPTALALHGAWQLSPRAVHVRGHHRYDITGRDVVAHVLKPSPPFNSAVDPVDVSVQVLLRDCPRQDAVVVADSIVNRRLLSLEDFAQIAQGLGRRGEAVLHRLDPLAESGTETLFRLWARKHNIQLSSQVPFGDFERVDFLIGKSLVVECDSVEHHTSLAAYENDRLRDLKLQTMGYAVVRLTYRQVMNLENGPGQQILTLIRRGAHLRDVPPLSWRARSLTSDKWRK